MLAEVPVLALEAERGAGTDGGEREHDRGRATSRRGAGRSRKRAWQSHQPSVPASVSAGAASPRKRIVAQNSVSGTRNAPAAATVVATASHASATAAASASARRGRGRAPRSGERAPTAVTGASQAQGSASRQPTTGS